MTDFHQGTFNFNAPGEENGYKHWKEELLSAQKEFENKYGIRIGKPVRVRLKNQQHSIVGIIHLKGDNPPILELNNQRFTPADIESLTLIQ